MLGLTDWINLAQTALNFPDEVLRLINALKATPQQQHEALLQTIEAEAITLSTTGRPKWDP